MPTSAMFNAAVAILAALVLGWTGLGAAQTTLNVVTAGDTNMHDLQRTVFAPEFEKRHPGVKVNAVAAPERPGAESS
jgi:ABC-type glycerol-3-phosphate transport system substrate-binding protein